MHILTPVAFLRGRPHAAACLLATLGRNEPASWNTEAFISRLTASTCCLSEGLSYLPFLLLICYSSFIVCGEESSHDVIVHVGTPSPKEVSGN